MRKKIFIVTVSVLICILFIVILNYFNNYNIEENEKSNILPNILSGAFGAAIVTGITTIYITKYKVNTPNTYPILEAQYNNIFVPIHKMIYFKNMENSKRIEESFKICENNYKYVPYKMIKYLENKEKLLNDVDFFYEYCIYIDDMLLVLRKNLGYYDTAIDLAEIDLEVMYPQNNKSINDKFKYKIEYYYDNIIDDKRTEVINLEKEKKVTKESLQYKIIKNRKDGYLFKNAKNVPLNVNDDNINKNIIEINYYSLDDDDDRNSKGHKGRRRGFNYRVKSNQPVFKAPMLKK